MTTATGSGALLIEAERLRQIGMGYDAAHDAEHHRGELVKVARYLSVGENSDDLPATPEWGQNLARKHGCDRIRELTIAGALIAAEIDRLLAEKATA